LINALAECDVECHVIAMRNPYDVMFTDQIKHFVCLYEYTPNAITTLIQYLKGDLKLEGRIPVTYA
jgi:beta-N-acetylhexosaminidase